MFNCTFNSCVSSAWQDPFNSIPLPFLADQLVNCCLSFFGSPSQVRSTQTHPIKWIMLADIPFLFAILSLGFLPLSLSSPGDFCAHSTQSRPTSGSGMKARPAFPHPFSNFTAPFIYVIRHSFSNLSIRFILF
jgi:hypothetical protein